MANKFRFSRRSRSDAFLQLAAKRQRRCFDADLIASRRPGMKRAPAGVVFVVYGADEKRPAPLMEMRADAKEPSHPGGLRPVIRKWNLESKTRRENGNKNGPRDRGEARAGKPISRAPGDKLDILWSANRLGY